jgi:hypothetical protein
MEREVHCVLFETCTSAATRACRQLGLERELYGHRYDLATAFVAIDSACG